VTGFDLAAAQDFARMDGHSNADFSPARDIRADALIALR